MKINVPVLIIGFLWWYEETEYFGFNKSTKSVEELFCDAISLFFFALAFLFCDKKDSIKFKAKSND